jgi:hypothetical protein
MLFGFFGALLSAEAKLCSGREDGGGGSNVSVPSEKNWTRFDSRSG